METRDHTAGENQNRHELLIVDDVRLFLQLTKTMFSREEYIIYTAADGRQALDIARSVIPDAVLLDLHMPEISGDEVCRQIRSDPLLMNIPVIIMTGDPDEETRRRCLYAGCDDLIVKPVRMGTIKWAVEKQLAVKKRKYPRKNVVLPCILDSGRDQLMTNIYTLSPGGAYVEIDPPPLPGSQHQLTFFLPEEKDHLSLRAQARWNRFDTGRRPPGSGFEFLDAEPETRSRLNNWARIAP